MVLIAFPFRQKSSVPKLQPPTSTFSRPNLDCQQMCLEENGHVKCIVSATKNNPLKLGYSNVSVPSIFFMSSVIHIKITPLQVRILLTHF